MYGNYDCKGNRLVLSESEQAYAGCWKLKFGNLQSKETSTPATQSLEKAHNKMYAVGVDVVKEKKIATSSFFFSIIQPY